MVDVIVGGSPCQDLSVAGTRAGLGGERSGLFVEQIRIVKEMRQKDERSGRSGYMVRPRYLVWENVPGAFSSNGGEDFRTVLEEICKVADESAVIPRPPQKWSNAGCIMGNGWSVAWRLHDAQFWGVPQRRKRISLIADFGGLSAPEILFERKGLRRDPQQSEAPEQGATGRTEESPDETITIHDKATRFRGGGKGRHDDGGGNGLGIGIGQPFPALSTSERHAVFRSTIFDARGNGEGNISPTITGDHQNRITDYTAIVNQHETAIQQSSE